MPILVATGGAAHSTVALTFGAHLAEVTGTSMTVLTVVKKEDERPRAETILASARFVLDELEANYQTRVRIGHPAEEILEEAEEGRYSMVVVGEKQHHGLVTRFLLGSTALRIVEHAPCPVVVVKGKVERVRRLVLCDSGYISPSLIEKMTQQLPKLLRGAESITVLHVMSQIGAGPGVDGHLLRAGASELIQENAPEGMILERDVRMLAQSGHIAEPKVRHGRVIDEVLAEAQQGDYDLVVIGAHQGTGWRRILLDDIAHEIVVALDRPVLVMR